MMYKQIILIPFVQRTVCFVAGIFLFLLLNGCVSNNHKPCCQFDWIPQLSEVNPQHTDTLTGGKEGDKVLNLMNIGGNLFSDRHFSLSQKLFMEASFEIEALYGMSAEARKLRQRFFTEAEKARSPYYEEQVKFFRGEPYERMMVYYYLGLSYLLKGDYENAHAAFINGQLQDAIAEEEQYQSDFPPLEGLLYFTARKMSSSVQGKHRKRLQEMRSELKMNHLKAPLIVIIESGQSATKIQQGKHKEILSFKCNTDEVSKVNVVSEKQTLPLIKSGYLCWQAITRGGREIDGILAQKALWKTTLGKIDKNSIQIRNQISDKQADAERFLMIEADVYTNSNNNSLPAAPTMSQFGSMMSTIQVAATRAWKKSVRPEADTRTWTTLPAHIWLGTIDQGSGDYVTIRYKKGNRNISKKVNISTDQNSTGVVWFKIK